jgi:hypothetical protein
MDNDSKKVGGSPKKKPSRLKKFLRTLLCILVFLVLAWTALSLIGRVRPESVIPDSAALRLSVSNPIRLLDGILAHESFDEISSVPALASALPALKMLGASPLMKNGLVRLAARGSLELAILPAELPETSGPLLAAMDLGFFSPLLRIVPFLSGIVNIPGLYYVQAGANSRFEYRMEDQTLFIGPYRNLLIVSDSSAVYESRAARQNGKSAFNAIKPSAYDAALLLSAEFVASLLAGQDEKIAEVLGNIAIDSAVEAGLSVYPKKLELRLAAPLSSGRPALGRLLEQQSRAPGIEERLPASQYATILSAGSLEELYQAALVFSPGLEDTLRRADSSARTILGLTLDEVLFSWTGNEFAVFGIEGRPHPVYMIQIKDERRRQAVFNKAFKSIVLDENVRLNLDGTRIPRIEIPEFLQILLRRWNLFLPSPYYIINKDFMLVSESAETLLAALRAMQRNEVLPKTAGWKEISGGKAPASGFSLYYSLDRSVPFFLRKNTALSGFLGAYRQGLVRMGFNRGLVDISLVLVPGSGNGVTPVSGYPIEIGRGASNKIFSSGSGPNSRILFTRGDTAISINPSDNSMFEFPAQGSIWVVPAQGKADSRDAAFAWVVSTQGRVTLVNGGMEAERGFPILTGLRVSSHPVSYNGKLYLCGEDGKVYTVDADGNQGVWETAFSAPVRSPPSFLAIQSGRSIRHYAAVYPKSFFGETWLLDSDGAVLPGWPVPISHIDDFGIGFGSPLLFAHNNRAHAAFVSQAGELSLYDESAAPVLPFPLMLDDVFYQQPVFDGEFLWLVSAGGNIFRVSLAGEVLYQPIPGFSVKEEGFIAVFDGDGDRVPEVFITGEGNALHAYSRNFRSLEGFPLPVWGKPLFVEPQGNKKPEIFGMGMDQRLYRWQFK